MSGDSFGHHNWRTVLRHLMGGGQICYYTFYNALDRESLDPSISVLREGLMMPSMQTVKLPGLQGLH